MVSGLIIKIIKIKKNKILSKYNNIGSGGLKYRVQFYAV